MLAALCLCAHFSSAITLEDVPRLSQRNGGNFGEEDTLTLFRLYEKKFGAVPREVYCALKQKMRSQEHFSPQLCSSYVQEYEMRLGHFRESLRRVARKNSEEGNEAIWGITRFSAMSLKVRSLCGHVQAPTRQRVGMVLRVRP